MGKTGSGKSTLVNLLLDAPLATIGHGMTGTTSVDTYNINKYGYDFVIYDTPGLFDVQNDHDKVIKEIAQIKKINIALICYDISQPRLFKEDIDTFREIKKQYGNNILEHSLLVFTKSNLVLNLEYINQTRYDMINFNIPMINAYDGSTSIWREELWLNIQARSKNKDYLIHANHMRIALCDPIKKIMNEVKNGLYPTNTQERVIREYELCIDNKNQERINMGLMVGIASLVGIIVLGTLTGGAGLMATLAMFGGGSLAAGGLGVAGGSVIISSLGFASGIAFYTMNDIDCKQSIEGYLINIINAEHYDTYKYESGDIAYSGNFMNNMPHGFGIAYDEFGRELWQGSFNKGVPAICKNIIY